MYYSSKGFKNEEDCIHRDSIPKIKTQMKHVPREH